AANFFPFRLGTTHFGGGTGIGAKVALTVVSLDRVTVQKPVPEQPPPDHPVKRDPDAAVAASVTCVPAVNACVQLGPQLMPAGLLVTLPDPVRATVSVWFAGGIAVKVAVRD